LIDGHAYAYRAFFAIRNLNAPDGRPTNAIFGFVKMLGRLQEMLRPSHCAVVWDGGIDRQRLEVHPEYKANRPPMPADLGNQIEAIGRFLVATKTCSVRRPGVEADDCLASLTRQAGKLGMPVVIASSDKDFMQLVSDTVGLINPGDMERGVWSIETVVEKTGVRPEQIVDWLSLTGDAVDNIPGVPGCGPKTAAKLLAQFQSLDEILKRSDRVQPERLGTEVRQSAERLLRNRDLIRLRDDLEVTLDLTEMEIQPADNAELASLYRQWGFKSLATEAEVRCQPMEQDLFALVRDSR